MACSSKSALCVSGLNEIGFSSKHKGVLGVCPSSCSLQFVESKSQDLPLLKFDFKGKQLIISDQKGSRDLNVKGPTNLSVKAQSSICISRAQRWWEKTLKPNMVEINSAQELVDSLLNAGDRLVIVDFYSPGCGGCKALHPKICQLAESNPTAIFLKVNYEELRTMCHTLHIHVLPFFRLYRGAEGRLCSFSCTNATIKKFKDALSKYGADRCSLGPAKGLDESEITKLASVGEISLDYLLPPRRKELMEDLIIQAMDSYGSLSLVGSKMEVNEDSSLLKV
ncbi:thioredoxin-like 1-2, chloroplastic [Malania oleifera]|uniref:thioredoxin-like 1-2, chloroplastic n=1 Tax=Malania oleifera TaxID=397392 RepID=UPI0025ADF759|nr:thioredoxin-like 1-2, chloroplastic [Malania oleifera]